MRRFADRREPSGASRDAAVAGPAETAGDRSDVALRKRLARMAFDVHDGPMQELIAVGYGLRALKETAQLSTDGAIAARQKAEIDQLAVQLSKTEQMLRSMMFSLEENSAVHDDVAAVVAELANAFERESSAAVDVITEGDLELHTDSQRIAVERVLRESLSNITRHADAANVTIELRGTRHALVLRVRDDGRGFDPDDRAREGIARIGLEAMRERLQMIGGTLTVDSRPGGPTTVTASIAKWDPQLTDEVAG
jgi:signal transduction histidine kinase